MCFNYYNFGSIEHILPKCAQPLNGNLETNFWSILMKVPPKFQAWAEVFEKKTSVGKKCPRVAHFGQFMIWKPKNKQKQAKYAQFSTKKLEKNIFQNYSKMLSTCSLKPLEVFWYLYDYPMTNRCLYIFLQKKKKLEKIFFFRFFFWKSKFCQK